ncbi:MAG: cell division protein FtsH, partial [Synergistaceae bacterium]|nr:cell division protein FtsH [Synergistaceae bacterium]
SEEIACAIDQEVRRIIDECMERVQVILNENFSKVDEISNILLEKEILEGAEFNRLLGFPEKEEEEDSEKENAGDVPAES